jgi:hypothetical protein
VYLPNPQNMELQDWCDQMGYIIGHFRNVNQLNGDDWRTWGKQFLLMPALSPLTLPDPDGYDDWRDYGERLSDAMGPADATLGNQFNGNALLTQGGSLLVTQSGIAIAQQ